MIRPVTPDRLMRITLAIPVVLLRRKSMFSKLLVPFLAADPVVWGRFKAVL
jgi:hypothetical protein